MSDVILEAKLEAANERLRRSAGDAKMRRTEMEARLSETGVLQVSVVSGCNLEKRPQFLFVKTLGEAL